MSPYLFVLVMDLFSDSMRHEALLGNLKLHNRCSDHMITNLSFTDDLIGFLNGDSETIEYFTRVLHDFRNCTGLKANHQKKYMCFVQE